MKLVGSVLLQATDYSAFHATLKDRVWYANATNKYRFGGSNGQERDDEVSGEGRSYSAEFWEYDAALGRRWNIDLPAGASL